MLCPPRYQIRRERRSVYEDAGVSVTAYRGDDITDSMMETAFFIYKSTIDKVCRILLDCRRKQIRLVTKEKLRRGHADPSPKPNPTANQPILHSIQYVFLLRKPA